MMPEMSAVRVLFTSGVPVITGLPVGGLLEAAPVSMELMAETR